jgi:asparagine synthetase B (glutamine-hydrolysing)
MCGIGCLIAQVESFDPFLLNSHCDNNLEHNLSLVSHQTNHFKEIETQIIKVIAPRGPHGTQSHIVKEDPVYISFHASLLALRGNVPVYQPVSDSKGNVLAWNGQIYDCENESDTLYLLNQLSMTTCPDEIYKVLSDLKGPFSFIYFHKMNNKIYFGRDVLGRRSLLYIYNKESKIMVLSSVATKLTPYLPNNDWRSISTYGIFCYDIQSKNLSGKAWSDIYNENCKKWVLSKRAHVVPSENIENISNLEDIINRFSEKLEDAVRKRVTNILNVDNLENYNVGILFSGGVDSVILTALTIKCLYEKKIANYNIDLLNVSFGSNMQQIQASADRQQSITAWRELKTLYPEASLRLILIDTLDSEIEPVRSIIEQLIYPQCTVIDFNIGCALWFASRGIGFLYTEDNKLYEPITSSATVLLCGIGSDEQLGGYKRHKNMFKRTKGNESEKWNALNNEMDKDVMRLWVRNLGRDDRVISYHGKEVRNPFLDEDFVMFVREIPLWIITNFEEVDEQGNQLPGDKRILRMAAYRMGLIASSGFTKRAMQFGSNVAKISYRKQHADTNINIKWD